MSQPTQTCRLCGEQVVVTPDGRGFPPDIAKRKLKRKCAARGCASEPQYRAGISPGGDTAPREDEWRVGTHYGIHVYEGDVPVATFFTAVDAARAVAAVNDAARPVPPGPAATREPPSFAEIAQAGEEWVHQGAPAATRDGEAGDRG